MNLQSIFKFLIVALLIYGCNSSQTKGNSSNEIKVVEKEGVVNVDGFKLKYIRSGKGDPIIIVGSSEYYSKAFSKELEKSFELIFVDSRHFAEDCSPTDEVLNNIDLSTFSADLDSIRKYLDLDKFGLIGHSIHGQIALDYAVKYPGNLTGLIIIGGVPYIGEEVDKYGVELWNTLANEERKAVFASNMKLMEEVSDSTSADRMFALSYHYNAPRYWVDPNFDASHLLNNLRTCPQAFGKLGGSLPSKNVMIKKLNDLSVPTLLILGKLDFAIPYQAWEELINNKTGIEYILMEKASHNPHTEKISQNEFDKHLTSWLR